MKNYWHKLFNRKKISYYSSSKKLNIGNKYPVVSYNLASVIHPNLTFRKFKNITNFLITNLNLKKNSSIIDYGSGNGAFIYYFTKKFSLKNNLSLEISEPLLKFQKEFLKKSKFVKTHHLKSDYFDKSKDNTFDYSYCNSVFQYFTSEKYAKEVLKFLIRTTKKNILIYDIKDYYKKKIYKETVRQRQGLSKIQFKDKYSNTPIRFYKKSFLIKVLNELRNKYIFNYKFKSLPSSATDYRFGYCLIIKKQ